MKPKSIDTARGVLSDFADYIDRHALLVERTGIELAIEVEALIDDAARHDLSLSKLEEEYELKGEGVNQLLIRLDPRDVGQLVRMAGGCERVPLTTEIKRKLKLYEKMLPSMTQRYDEVAYIDEFEPDAIADKKSFVFETLNLAHDKPAEVVSFFHKVMAEHQFSHTMFGKQFLVAREYASSLGFYVIALLASGE